MWKIDSNNMVNCISVALAGIISVIAVICTGTRISATNGGYNVQILASSLSMPQGKLEENSKEIATAKPRLETQIVAEVPTTEQSTNGNISSKPQNQDDDSITDDESSYSGDTFPVIEQQIGGSGEGYDNFSVKNNTDYEIDYETLLSSKLGFEITDTSSPQVLIVHTHTTESYLINDNGYYYTDYPFRTENPKRNMIAVGDKIVSSLEKNGIKAVHATEIHDRTYTGSYDRSAETIYKYLAEYPDIKVILDIHRDAIGYDDERGKYKPTFTYNGKKGAQIMIMSGYDPYGEYDFANWEQNLIFALKLQNTAETLYPGMTRPLCFGDFAYNMPINNGSLLIEVGTETNTLSEAKYTGELLGNVIADVLNKSKS